MEAHANLWSVFISLPFLSLSERGNFSFCQVVSLSSEPEVRAERRDPVSNGMFGFALCKTFGPSLLSLEEMVDILLLVAVQVEHPS